MPPKLSPPAIDFPFRAGDDVRLAADPAHRDTVVEVQGRVAELRNGLWYTAEELRPANDPDEKWIDLPGYDGRYRLSSHGKLLATDYRLQGRARLFTLGKPAPGRVVAYTLPDEHNESLDGPGRTKQRQAGRLVAEHFLPPPPSPAWRIGYKDRDRANLRADNLFWFNPRESRNEALNEYLNRKTVLSAEQAAEALRELAGKAAHNETVPPEQRKTNATIAAAFGVDEEVIKQLARKAGYATERPKPEDKEKTQARVRAALAAGQRPVDVARAFGMNRSSVWRIQRATP